MVRIGLAVLMILIVATSVEAQQERNPGFMVHQLLVCPDSNMGEINRLSALSNPILDQLVEEGMIRAWYDLRHAWGDEWNVSYVTVADSHRAWLDYWSEYLRRISEAHPTLFEEFTALCTMHKDNMYSIRDSNGNPR